MDGKRLKLPLSIDGEIGEPAFMLDAFPDRDPPTYHMMIVMEPTICRLDYDLTAKHINEISGPISGLPSMVRGPHFHPWKENRHLAWTPNKAIRLANAFEVPRQRTFDSTLRWFCAEHNITLPPSHMIELPPKERLL